MAESKTIATTPIEICCVCMDESKTIIPHPCKTCSENSWIVCNECSKKLKKCPICRQIIQNDNDLSTNNSYRNERRFVINQCLLWLIAIIQVLFAHTCLVYTGKLYYYIICSIHCNTFSLKKIQECKCYHVSEPNFLINYSKIVSETVIGIIIAATFLGIYKGIRLCYLNCVRQERVINNEDLEEQEEV